LVTSLLDILVKQRSLQLYTNTPVTSITSPSKHKKYYTIHTTRGTVKARHIVNATNAWIGHLYPEFQSKIIPTRGQLIQVPCQTLDVTPMSWNNGAEYLIQRPDSSVILGGGRRFSSTKHAELGNADDTTIDPSVSKFLHTFLPSQLPIISSEGTPPPVKSEREWTGIMGFSEDGNPFVGNDVEEPRRWVIGGFHGHGMVRIYLCAKALAEKLLAVDDGREMEWPEWMPRGYIHHPDRVPAGEVKEFMTLRKDIPES